MRPKPRDFQFLWSERISKAKMEEGPVWSSMKVRRSDAVDDRGMLVTRTVVVVVVLSCAGIFRRNGKIGRAHV